MLKKLLFLSITIYLCFSINSSSYAQSFKKSDAVYILIQTFGLDGQLPANIDTLNPRDAYKIQINVLSANGINAFNGSSFNENIRKGELAAALYYILGSEENLPKTNSIQEIIDNLAYLGILEPGSAKDIITENQLITLTQNTMLLANIPAAYQSSTPINENNNSSNENSNENSNFNISNFIPDSSLTQMPSVYNEPGSNT